MANRQYIGARYVPKFANPVEWDNIRQYEAMTIVTHLGNSFTSKKPVPAGVDIANTDYWVNTGNYNAQVAEYQQQVVNLNALVNPYVDRLDMMCDTFANKRILIIGDSLSDEDMADAPARNPVWVVAFRDMVEPFGATVTNVSKRGRGYQHTADGYNFGTILNTLNLNSYDIIIVFGGINDFLQGTPPGVYGTSASGTMWAGVKSVAEKLKETTAACYFVSPMCTTVKDSALPYCTPDVYRAIIASVARVNGFFFINGNNIPWFGVENAHMSDNLHPNGAYTKYIARYIFNKMMYGSEDFMPSCELYQGKNLTGTNCTFDAYAAVMSPNEMMFDFRGTATGQISITIPNNLGIWTGQAQMVAGCGGASVYMITGHNSIVLNGLGSGVSGAFHIIMRGMSDSIADFNFFTENNS